MTNASIRAVTHWTEAFESKQMIAQVTRNQPVTRRRRVKRDIRNSPLVAFQVVQACGHECTAYCRTPEEKEEQERFFSERLCTLCFRKSPADLRRAKRDRNHMCAGYEGDLWCEEPFCPGRVSQAEARHSQRVHGGAILCADCAAADVLEAA